MLLNKCGNASHHRTGLVMLWYRSGLFGTVWYYSVSIWHYFVPIQDDVLSIR
jgi:hypothetical protein